MLLCVDVENRGNHNSFTKQNKTKLLFLSNFLLFEKNLNPPKKAKFSIFKSFILELKEERKKFFWMITISLMHHHHHPSHQTFKFFTLYSKDFFVGKLKNEKISSIFFCLLSNSIIRWKKKRICSGFVGREDSSTKKKENFIFCLLAYILDTSNWK